MPVAAAPAAAACGSAESGGGAPEPAVSSATGLLVTTDQAAEDHADGDRREDRLAGILANVLAGLVPDPVEGETAHLVGAVAHAAHELGDLRAGLFGRIFRKGHGIPPIETGEGIVARPWASLPDQVQRKLPGSGRVPVLEKKDPLPGA